jgi:hypothetical protein
MQTSTSVPINDPPPFTPQPPPIVAWRGAFTSDTYTKLVDPRVRWALNFKDKSLDLTFSTNVNGERASSFLIQISFKAAKEILREFLAKSEGP